VKEGEKFGDDPIDEGDKMKISLKYTVLRMLENSLWNPVVGLYQYVNKARG